MYNTGHHVQSMPKYVSIQRLAPYKKYVDKNLYAILWNILTFMKFCGDYSDIYEEKKIISNASWEILNRTFFNRISKYNGGKQVNNHGYRKKNIKNEKNIFHR